MKVWKVASLNALVLAGLGGAVTPAETDAPPQKPEVRDWASIRRTYDLQAHSPLVQIDKRNVSQLRPVWSYSVPQSGTWSIAPLVANGVMYLSESGRIVALDAVSGEPIWIHQRNFPEDIALSQANNRTRGLAMAGDVIYWGTADAHVVAIDARTGRSLWETVTSDYRLGAGHNHPGLVAEGKLFIGQSGGDRGVPGRFRALDAATGRILWTVRTAPAPGDPGFETWGGGENFPPRGAAPWNTISYDPELRVAYFGTGQPGPWSSAVRGLGDALYANTILAVDTETGKIRWHFQMVPGDDWDRAVFESVLVDLEINGRMRRALIATSKVGWAVVLDRSTGAFLNAFKVAYDNTITGWTEEGRPIMDPAKKPRPEDIGTDKTFLICPSIFGARNLNSGAYSPETKLFYLGVNNNCADMRPTAVTYAPGRNYAGAGGPVMRAPGHDYVGEFVAFDPVSGLRRWAYRAPNGAGMSASALSTASGLVFGGTVDRQFFALDSASGDLLWQTRLNGDISGAPVTYEVDGRQFIAVTSGGRSLNAAGMAPLSNITLPQGSGVVWVFALPGPADLAPIGTTRQQPIPVSTSGLPAAGGRGGRGGAGRGGGAPSLFTAAQAARGEAIFRQACLRCHPVEEQTGAAFRAKWGAGTAADVFTLIATTMPQENPGTLTRQDYADIVAFMLRESGYTGGTTDLPASVSALSGLRLQPAP